MTIKWWQILVSGLLMAILAFLAGCGSGSMSTNGTLSVADITSKDLTGGMYSVETSATFTSGTGKVLPGTVISYSATFAGSTTTTRAGNLSTDSTGMVPIGPWQITQDTVPIIVTINATTGGLTTTKTASIPAISALTVTPQAVAFASTDTAGTTRTVAVTGGFSPYTASSVLPADIGTAISGGTVTITKLAASGLNNSTTTVTVTDKNGNQQTVVVGYFK